MKFDAEKHEAAFDQLLKRFSYRLKSLYGDYAYKAAKLIDLKMAIKASSDGPIINEKYLESYLKNLTKEFAIELQKLIEKGFNSSLDLSYLKYIALTGLVASVINRKKIRLLSKIKDLFTISKTEPDPIRNELLEAHKNKTFKGFKLSERVWKISSQFEIELMEQLRLGVMDGIPAAKIARRIKIHLNNPDALFRRVRNEAGKLIPSKAMQAFHPGQGVYRSAYKNALRLAVTELNSIYRKADHLRWQSNDAVLGFEVKLSNRHGAENADICDHLKGRYPKGFLFTGWHPLCRCYAIPMLPNQDDFLNYLESGDKAIMERQRVNNVPNSMAEWVHYNNDKILAAKSKMFFIDDNFKLENGKLILKI